MRQAAAATAVDPANPPSPSRSGPGNRHAGASMHISDMTSVEPFNRLVKLAARAFYDNISMKGDSIPKSFRGDNRGIGVVVLDALTRREWVREEILAKDLKLHSSQLRHILFLFEEEKLVTRYRWKESVKGAKAPKVAAAAAGDGQPVTKQGEEKSKMHTHSYCCLDYAQNGFLIQLDCKDGGILPLIARMLHESILF